jgi:L-ascorbate metabolism protein UlaG (beta-lactamase superfamily)
MSDAIDDTGNMSRVNVCGWSRFASAGIDMKIKWYGHACFRIESEGIALVTDPYTPEVAGLNPVEEPADVVIMSSATDSFHSCASMVPGDPKVLNALEIASSGPVEVKGVAFEALPTMESLEHKESLDENAIYRFELERVSILHLGDLGNPLTDEQLERLRGRVDILLALTGGPPTIELQDLDQAIEEIGPRIVIPMHYQIPELKLDILPLEAFTSRYPKETVRRVGATEVELSPDTLPRTLRIYVLDPAG